MTYGTMQGRITAPRGRGMQFFPQREWKEELKLAGKLHIDEIEWVFDAVEYEKSLLWDAADTDEIRLEIQKSGTKVKNLCFHYLVQNSFLSGETTKETRGTNLMVLERVCTSGTKIGIVNIDFPVFGVGKQPGSKTMKQLESFIMDASYIADDYGMSLSVETDLKPILLQQLLEKIHVKNLRVAYDVGNSASCGYNITEEFARYGHLIENIHIKDRPLGGGTVPLGQGDANFTLLREELGKVGYDGSIILEACRGEEGKEVDTLCDQIAFSKAEIY